MERSLLLLWWRHPSYTSSLNPQENSKLLDICTFDFSQVAFLFLKFVKTTSFRLPSSAKTTFIPPTSIDLEFLGALVFSHVEGKRKKCCHSKTFIIQIERKCLKVKVGSISTKKGPAPESGTSNQISPSKLDQIQFGQPVMTVGFSWPPTPKKKEALVQIHFSDPTHYTFS